MTSSHDTHDADSAHVDAAHAAEPSLPAGGPPTGAAEPATPVRAFIWPGLIALLALILVWGPVTRSFDRFSAGPGAAATEQPATESTPVGVKATLTVVPPVTGN